MKTEQCIYSLEKDWKKKSENNLSSSAQLVFMFGDEVSNKFKHY